MFELLMLLMSVFLLAAVPLFGLAELLMFLLAETFASANAGVYTG